MDQVTFLALPSADQVRLKNSAKIAQKLENRWEARIQRHLDSLLPELVEALADRTKMPDFGLEELLTRQYFDVSISAMRYAETEREMDRKIPKRRLARDVKIPKSLKRIREQYDLWRKGKVKPKYPASKAIKIQREYLKTVKSAWEKYSKDFREGKVADQKEVVEKIRRSAQVEVSRAKTIVRTETTNYYNAARKEYYDESEDITHYLLIAIRDAATSPWCTPNYLNGKRGRSGLVYAKTDPLCDQERPACHPGCRSEYLPLNNLNPAHLKYIQDKSIQRRQHTCFPLLRGWRS